MSHDAANAVPVLLVQWQHNGVDLPGRSGPVLDIANFTEGNRGVYTVCATNRAGTRVSAPIVVDMEHTVSVPAPPPSLRSSPP